MNRFSALALTFSLCVGTMAMVAKDRRRTEPDPVGSARLATDGAFRDGLYLGRLSAQQRLPRRLVIGRWSRPQDRVSFIAGYRRGYDTFLASSTAVLR